MPSGGYCYNVLGLATFFYEDALQASFEFNLMQGFLLNHSFASVFHVALYLDVVTTTTIRMVHLSVTLEELLLSAVIVLRAIMLLLNILELLTRLISPVL